MRIKNIYLHLHQTITKMNNNKLSLKSKFSYKKGVELYQLIQNFELGLVSLEDFETESQKIENKYIYADNEEKKGILTDLY